MPAPLQPWTIIIARGSLAIGPARNTDDEMPDFVTCAELSQRLRLPVVAAMSTAGSPPYTRSGQYDISGAMPDEEVEIREALEHALFVLNEDARGHL